MGPIILFDKSFLQSLSVDESVWFDHFFVPVLSPVFLIESLADLTKQDLRGRTPPQEVALLANKTPEMSGFPCVSHDTLCLSELNGWPVAMTGQVIVAGGKRVILEGKKGVVHEQSPEAEAFGRWLQGEFRQVERIAASRWRQGIETLDLRQGVASIAELDLVGLRCTALQEAKDKAAQLVAQMRPAQALKLLSMIVNIPTDVRGAIYFRWVHRNLEPIASFAPYCAHVLTVELFFWIAMGCGLISTERPSNRVDIWYLFYLPFCMVFTSSDKLHRRTAALFLRGDQEFVEGSELKTALHEIDERYAQLPSDVLEQGVFRFAHTPPEDAGTLVRELWRRHLAPHALEPSPADEANVSEQERVMREQKAFTRAAKAGTDSEEFDSEDADALSYERRVRLRKGKWFQLPKGIKVEENDE